MLQGHTYFIRIVARLNRVVDIGIASGSRPPLSDYAPTQPATVYLDDVIFEENVTAKVIVGYEAGEKTYDPFFYIGTVAPFATNGYTVTLPEYFRGLNYRVFTFDAGNADHVASVASIDNTVPSITFQGSNTGDTYGNNFIVVI